MKLTITNSNLSELVSTYPEIVKSLHHYFISRIVLGAICSIISIFFILSHPIIGTIFLGIAIYLFYKSYKYNLAYKEARQISGKQLHNPAKRPSPNQNFQFTEYEQLYRHPASDNNLNYDCYVFSAKYSKTNRMRTNRQIHIFAGQDVKEEIIKAGYIAPIEYHLEKPCPATERQINYLRDLTSNSVPDHLSIEDATALITRITENDHIANPQLFEFASQMHIGVSYYAGKKLLYGIIFNSLNDLDRIAFFAFQVYRHISNDYGNANMNRSIHKDLFYEFAASVKDDSSFLASMNRYEGKSLRFFGTKTINGHTITGGSKNTIAYKKAKDFLKDRI